MPYAITITPVGSNEYSLIRTLHESILEPFASADWPDIEPGLNDAGIQVLAHLEGNPVGYLVARVDADGMHLLGCGVMELYRRRNICGRMIDWLQARAGAMHLQTHVTLPPLYQDMIRLLDKRNAGVPADPAEQDGPTYPPIIVHQPSQT